MFRRIIATPRLTHLFRHVFTTKPIIFTSTLSAAAGTKLYSTQKSTLSQIDTSFPGGFKKEILKPGDGKTFPQKGQTVIVHYTGWLLDGTKFDSSVDRQQPFSFKVGKGYVIRGWDEAVLQMSVGEKSRVVIKPEYAYGKRGEKNNV